MWISPTLHICNCASTAQEFRRTNPLARTQNSIWIAPSMARMSLHFSNVCTVPIFRPLRAVRIRDYFDLSVFHSTFPSLALSPGRSLVALGPSRHPLSYPKSLFPRFGRQLAGNLLLLP